MEPIVPNTITTKAGNSKPNPTSGLIRNTITSKAPPRPERPAERNEEIVCILSILIPDDAAKEGLSETALIFLPSDVFLNIIINNITLENTPITKAVFANVNP